MAQPQQQQDLTAFNRTAADEETRRAQAMAQSDQALGVKPVPLPQPAVG